MAIGAVLYKLLQGNEKSNTLTRYHGIRKNKKLSCRKRKSARLQLLKRFH
jgi:hypothetical protein